MLESDADRLASLQQLGELAKVGGRDVWGVFENNYLDALSDPGIAESAPEFTARSIDLEQVEIETNLVRESGEKFVVREIEPDGTGMTLLRLR